MLTKFIKFAAVIFLVEFVSGTATGMISNVEVNKRIGILNPIVPVAVAESRTLGLTTLLLLPILLPIIILLGLALIFFPIPVISIPTGRRVLEATEDIFNKNEGCIERLICELAKSSTGDEFQRNWIQKFLSQITSRSVMDKIAKATNSKKCVKYPCTTFSDLRNALEKIK